MKRKNLIILLLIFTFCSLASITLFACGTKVAPESISFIQNNGTILKEVTLYKNNYLYIDQFLNISPKNANGYTLQWSSSNESKVDISFTNNYEVKIRALDYTYDNPVTILCKIKDTDLSASIKVNVTDGEIYNMFIDQTLEETTFYAGQEFNKDILIVWGEFESGEKYLIPVSELEITVDFPLKVGSILYVKYGNFKASINLNVIEDTIETLNIEQNPNKINYLIGEIFDPTGMVISAKYASGKTEIISNYTFENSPFTYKDNSITISYKNASVNLPLTISATTTVTSYSNLQSAIDNANVGDSIMIGGTEHINVGTIYIPVSKNLTIYGKTLKNGYTKITSVNGKSIFKIINDANATHGNTLTIANLELSASDTSLICYDEENSKTNLNNTSLTIDNVKFNYNNSSTGLNLSGNEKFSPLNMFSLTINILNCTFQENDLETDTDFAIYIKNIENSNINIDNCNLNFDYDYFKITNFNNLIVKVDGNQIN